MPRIRDLSTKVFLMEKELHISKMVDIILEILLMVMLMDMGFIYILMDLFMKVSFLTQSTMDKALLFMLIEDWDMMGILLMDCQKGKAEKLMQMAQVIKVSFIKDKNMDKVFISGQMDKDMKAVLQMD